MSVSIVLVRPRNPQNIGAAARAMGNFRLGDLRVVSPYEPTWREAVSAVGAHEILKKAGLYDNLKDALFDADLVLATTALKNRRTDRPIISLPSLGGYLEECVSKNTAIVFGSEKTGLNKEDIALAHGVLNIPTSAEVPSINLAQAVVLCCYELSKIKPLNRAGRYKKPDFKEVEIVKENISSLLSFLDLPPVLGDKVCKSRLEDLAARRMLDKEDLFFVNTIVRRIISKMRGKEE